MYVLIAIYKIPIYYRQSQNKILKILPKKQTYVTKNNLAKALGYIKNALLKFFTCPLVIL